MFNSSSFDIERLNKQLHFIKELDKMKTELRRNIIIDKSRRENDAEHSWHISIMAMTLLEYAEHPDKLDLLKILKILLMHDVVEIYAGDTFFFDEKANEDKRERELAAADRIFSLLPSSQAEEFRSLWDEYEAMKTPEAIYAGAMDRLQPFLLHYYTHGQVWRQEHVTSEKVYKRIGHLRTSMPNLWPFIEHTIQKCLQKGYLEK